MELVAAFFSFALLGALFIGIPVAVCVRPGHGF